MTAYRALVTYALRTGGPRRRWLWALPTALAVLLGLVVRNGSEGSTLDFVRIVGTVLTSLLLPLVALVVADGVLTSEIRHGSYALTWLSPVPHRLAVVGRWSGGLLLVLAGVLPGAVIAALVGGVPDAVPAVLVATTSGAAAYLALFLLIGAWSRRAIAWSLGFVLVVERFLGATLNGIATLSPGWLSQGALTRLAGETAREGVPSGTTAVLVLLLVFVPLLLSMASWRLGKLQLSGASD